MRKYNLTIHLIDGSNDNKYKVTFTMGNLGRKLEDCKESWGPDEALAASRSGYKNFSSWSKLFLGPKSTLSHLLSDAFMQNICQLKRATQAGF
jgi:hypothetical protein